MHHRAMARLLTLSRAARLVGVTRGALQNQIKRGELETFEGFVSADDLVRLYPQTRFEDDSAIERARQIKDSAFAKRVRERILPDAEVLAARLNDLGRELADIKRALAYQEGLVTELAQRLEAAAVREPNGATVTIAAWLREARAAARPAANAADALLARDSFLRVMAAHVHLLPSQHDFFVEGADTVLEAALRAGLNMNYGCSNGNCGLCKARVVSGRTKKVRNHDYVMPENEKAHGFVLLCSHTAVTDCTFEAPEGVDAGEIPLQQIAARVHQVTPLSEEMTLLHLQTPRTNRLRFLAGQSVMLSVNDEPAREFPIASCPCDDRNLQFHIPRRADDPFLRHVANNLRPSNTVMVEGPRGEFVLDDTSPRPLVFIAYGAGFAPSKSLIEHAMALDVAGTLHLYWITEAATGQYLQNLCRAWADALDNFYYVPIVIDPARATLALEEQLAAHHGDWSESDYYLAGNTAALDATQALLVRHGVPAAQIIRGAIS